MEGINKHGNNIFISNTLKYFCMGILVFFYYLIFGVKELSIGILMGVAGISLLNKDFTNKPFISLVKFALINLSIAVATYLASKNIYLGLFINFIAIFAITYLLIYNLETSIYFPFILIYIFMMIEPVDFHGFKLRLGALLLGSLYIMFLQSIFNKNKEENIRKASFNTMALAIYDTICAYSEGRTAKKKLKSFKTASQTWLNTVYEARDSYFYLSEKESLEVNAIIALESFLDKLVNLHKSEKDYSSILGDLDEIGSSLVLYSVRQIGIVDLNSTLLNKIEEYETKYKDDFEVYNLIDSLNTLRKSLIGFNELDKANSESKQITFKELVTYTKLILKNNFNKNSLRFTFAFKTAFLISILNLIISYFKLQNGGWLLVTALMLLIPYKDNINKKAQSTIIGTIIGLIVLGIVTYFFKLDFRVSLVLAAFLFYIKSFFKNSILCCATICIISLLLASIAQPLNTISLTKIIYTLLACASSIAVSYLVFPYSLKDSTEALVSGYSKISYSSLNLIFNNNKDDNFESLLEDAFFVSKIIEHKILINNFTFKNEDLSNFLIKEHALMESLYDLSLNLFSNKVIRKDFSNIKLTLKESNLLPIKDNIVPLKSKLKTLFASTKNIDDKTILLDLYNVLNAIA